MSGPGNSNGPQIKSFTVNPSSAAAGTQVTFTWATTNATAVSIDNGVGSNLPASGSQTFKAPAATTTFTLTATGSGTNATSQATLTVTAPKDIHAVNHIIYMIQENRSFDHYFGRMNTYRVKNGFSTSMTDVDTLDNPSVTATPNPAAGTAALAWNTSNATTVTLNGAPVSSSGSMDVSPSTATLFTLSASNGASTATASIAVGVTPDSGSRIIAGVSPTTINSGDTAMLSFATTDQSAVTVNPAPDPQHTLPYGPHSRIPIKPTTTTTYSLTSSSGLSTTVTVNVGTIAGSAPTASITDQFQGHVSLGSAATVSPFLMTDQCPEDLSPDWSESHSAFHLGDNSSNVYLGNGFVHISAGFAQFANATADPYHFFDVRGARGMEFFDDSILNYYYFMGAQFGISDRWFSPISTNSASNRLAEMAATSKGTVHGDRAFLGSTPTIFDRLQAAGISWKVYYSDIDTFTGKPNTTLTQFAAGTNFADHLVPVDCTKPTTPCGPGQSDYFTDLKNGTLPQVAQIEPVFNSGTDEHPGNPVQIGAAYVATIINSLMASSSWKDSVFVLTWDEGGGFYDHVSPATATPPDSLVPLDPARGGDLITHFSGGQWVDKDAFTFCGNNTPSALPCAGMGFDRTGYRLPVIVVSPFTKKHFVFHPAVAADNTAILAFVEKRFNLQPLTARDAAQPDMSDFFDFTGAPWATPPTPPTQSTNASCFQKKLF